MKPRPSNTEIAAQKLHAAPSAKARALAVRKAETVEKRRAKDIEAKHQEQWKQIMKPLAAEILRVNGCLYYKSANDMGRDEALSMYHEVLLTLRERLASTAHTIDGERQTPKHAALAKNIPNEGVHWTDWVPQKIRARVEAAFAAVPYKPRARTVKPFKRTIPKAQHAELLGKLRKRMLADMDNIQRLQNIKEDDDRTAEIERMHQALRVMDTLPPDSPVPRDWRKLGFALAITKADGCQE